MTDFVLIDGDKAIFEPSFGAAIIIPMPGTISGTGDAMTVSGKTVCIEGDESSVEVSGVAYTAGPYATPGTGTLTISALADDQKATNLKVNNKAVLLVGSSFTAKFSVNSGAVNPNSGVLDSTPEYSGKGSFTTTNSILKAE